MSSVKVAPKVVQVPVNYSTSLTPSSAQNTQGSMDGLFGGDTFYSDPLFDAKGAAKTLAQKTNLMKAMMAEFAPLTTPGSSDYQDIYRHYGAPKPPSSPSGRPMFAYQISALTTGFQQSVAAALKNPQLSGDDLKNMDLQYKQQVANLIVSRLEGAPPPGCSAGAQKTLAPEYVQKVQELLKEQGKLSPADFTKKAVQLYTEYRRHGITAGLPHQKLISNAGKPLQNNWLDDNNS
jgi:hypothetical protein